MGKHTVALIGAAQTKFKTHYADKTYVELAQDAAKQAKDLHDGEMREKQRWGYVINMGREGGYSA